MSDNAPPAVADPLAGGEWDEDEVRGVSAAHVDGHRAGLVPRIAAPVAVPVDLQAAVLYLGQRGVRVRARLLCSLHILVKRNYTL